jgi:hypothetical protein
VVEVVGGPKGRTVRPVIGGPGGTTPPIPKPGPSPAPGGTSSSSSGGTSGGGAGGAGGGGGAPTPTSAPTPAPQVAIAVPKLAPPSWWHGAWPPNAAAATIRDGWFALLGDLSQFPYNADLFYAAYVYLELVSLDVNNPQVPLPVQVTITVLDPAGNTAGSFSGSVTELGQELSAGGSFSLDLSYTVQVEYTLPGATAQHTATFGPFPGSALVSSGVPQALSLTVNDFPATANGGLTIQYPDGTPAAGVFVSVGISALGTTPSAGLFGEDGYANSAGVFDFSFGYDLGSGTEYSIYWDIYSAAGGQLLAIGGQNASGADLAAGNVSATITLPPKGQGISHGEIVFECLQNCTYEYSCKNQDGTTLASSSGSATAEKMIHLPPPTGYAPTDELTFTVSAKNSGQGGTKGPKTSSDTVTGAYFSANGVNLYVDFGGGGPPHHGRT